MTSVLFPYRVCLQRWCLAKRAKATRATSRKPCVAQPGIVSRLPPQLRAWLGAPSDRRVEFPFLCWHMKVAPSRPQLDASLCMSRLVCARLDSHAVPCFASSGWWAGLESHDSGGCPQASCNKRQMPTMLCFDSTQVERLCTWGIAAYSTMYDLVKHNIAGELWHIGRIKGVCDWLLRTSWKLCDGIL